MAAAQDSRGPARTPGSSQFPANLASVVTGVLVIALGMAALMWWVSGADDAKVSSTKPVKTLGFTELVESTTHTSLRGAPKDPNPQARTHGDIVRPKKVIAIHDRPAGSTIGKVGPKQIGETWLPVINRQQGWTQVLLPSKPNGSTGWLRDGQLRHKVTPYLITVHLKSMKLQLFHQDRKTGEWTIGIGKSDTPTPTGRTFLLGSIVDPNQQYSPIILPLGSHSDTLDSFGGGPGTVAIHTWPTTDVFGAATSHGCIRVPKDALDRLTQVPLGTLVLVDQQ